MFCFNRCSNPCPATEVRSTEPIGDVSYFTHSGPSSGKLFVIDCGLSGCGCGGCNACAACAGCAGCRSCRRCERVCGSSGGANNSNGCVQGCGSCLCGC